MFASTSTSERIYGLFVLFDVICAVMCYTVPCYVVLYMDCRTYVRVNESIHSTIYLSKPRDSSYCNSKSSAYCDQAHLDSSMFLCPTQGCHRKTAQHLHPLRTSTPSISVFKSRFADMSLSHATPQNKIVTTAPIYTDTFTMTMTIQYNIVACTTSSPSIQQKPQKRLCNNNAILHLAHPRHRILKHLIVENPRLVS